MEINKLVTGLDPYKQQAKVEKADTDATRKSSGSSAAKTGDKVSLSPEARQRTEAYKEAMSTPDVRRERVEELKGLVERGEYQVDSQKVAQNLLKDEMDLFL